jgi:heme oxygenase (mycobilin-producing)
MVRVIVEHPTKSKEDAEKLIGVILELRHEAMKQPGYITGETLIDMNDPCSVLVISTWNKPENWEAWDKSESRVELTRQKLLPLLREPYTIRYFTYAKMSVGRVVSVL